jgi:hypothetical protein
MMKLIDVVQRLKLVNDYDQCRAAMNDAIVEIESLRQQLTKPAPEAQILIDAKRAIEHGEYLAKSAESLLNYLNEVSNEDEGTIEPDDRFGDYTQGIRLSVHEFRKRAERYDTKATPDNGVEK